MKSRYHESLVIALMMSLCTGLIVGCSSSSDINTTDGSSSSTTAGVTVPGGATLENGSIEANDNLTIPTDANTGNGVDDTSNGTLGSSSDEDTSNGGGDLDSELTTDGVDPLIQNVTQVIVDITVPAYQSNVLQLTVAWGEISVVANWVGDEFWRASLDAPTATEHPLLITFSDNNGDLTLATYESTYETGINASETIQVAVEQFDSDQWDSDGDGISNLEELRTGTDPLLDDRVPLEIRESFDFLFVERVSRKYESRIPADRPFYEHTDVRPEELIRPYSIRVDTIDIDENGNGRYVDTSEFEGQSDRYSDFENGTRTHAGDSVTWVGTSRSFDSGSGRSNNQKFTIKTTYIDEETRHQEGVVVVDNCCATFEHDQDLTYNLTGLVIDDSTECEPIAGSLVRRDSSFYIRGELLTSASKDIEDEYWRVSITRDDILEEEFFAESISTTFYCEFSDLDSE